MISSSFFCGCLAIALGQVQPAKLTQPKEAPELKITYGHGNMAFVESPHQNQRPPGTVIDTIVLHHTAGPSLEGTVKWFTMPESQVSAHYTIGKDGKIVQHVSTYYRAWHAGKSIDSEGRSNVNNFSIGIEMVNIGDGKDPWTKEQVEAVHRLLRVLLTYRFKTIKTITSHEYIAEPKGRKNDPLGFPWAALKDLESQFGVKIITDLQKTPKKQTSGS
jgi:N-acetyl-anhydromuramyl-L-alanine amidase AmpD